MLGITSVDLFVFQLGGETIKITRFEIDNTNIMLVKLDVMRVS